MGFLTDILSFVIKKIAGILVFMGLMYGGGFFFLEQNPALKAQVYGTIKGLMGMVNGMTGGGQGGVGGGINLGAALQSLQGIAGGATGGGVDDTTDGRVQENGMSYDINNVAQMQGVSPEKLQAMMQSMTGAQSQTPACLEPFLSALKDSPKFPEYQKRLSTKNVGEDGKGAIPILEKALNSKSPTLREAAYRTLKGMELPEAKLVLDRNVR